MASNFGFREGKGGGRTREMKAHNASVFGGFINSWRCQDGDHEATRKNPSEILCLCEDEREEGDASAERDLASANRQFKYVRKVGKPQETSTRAYERA